MKGQLKSEVYVPNVNVAPVQLMEATPTPEALELTSSQQEDYSNNVDLEVDVVEHCTVIKTDASELEPELLNSQEIADLDFIFESELPSSFEEEQIEDEETAQNLDPLDLEGYYYKTSRKSTVTL